MFLIHRTKRTHHKALFCVCLSISCFATTKPSLNAIKKNVICSRNLSDGRVANLISANYSSLRTLHTKALLESIGFDVRLVKSDFSPEHPSSKPWANRSALIKALMLIISDKHRWGYIFEDDITWNDLNFTVSLDGLMRAEKPDLLFQYLGVCRTENTGTEGQNGCGRCTHAMAITKEGAKEVIDFSTQYKPILSTGNVPHAEPYLDVIMEEWCVQQGGFPILGPYHHKFIPGHIGIFVQDRARFASQID